jgi:hypothetical protein
MRKARACRNNSFLKSVSETWFFIEKLEEGQNQRTKMSVSLKPSSQPYSVELILWSLDKCKINAKVT